MATSLEYLLTLNTKAGQQRVQQLYNQANALFSQKGVNLKINAGGSSKLPLGQFSSDLRKFETSLDAATARVAAFTSATTLLYGMGKAFKALATDSIAVEKAMTKIQAIFQGTTAELNKMQKDLFRVANLTGQSFYDTADAAAEFARQGLTLQKTIEATTAAMLLARLSGSSLDNTIQGLVTTMSTFNDETLDYIKVVNILSAVDAKFSTSAAGLVEGIKRVGSVAADAGLSFAELSSYIAAVKQTSGRSESVIGNGFKTIFTNLQNSKVQEQLEKIGVATRDLAGDFLPLTDVLQNLTEKFKSLTDAQKADLSQKIAGKFQINTFKALTRSIDSGLYGKALGVAESASDQKAAERRNELLNKTTASSLQRLQNSYVQFNTNVGGQVLKPAIDNAIGSVGESLDLISKAAGTQFGKALLKGIGDAISGPGIIYLLAIFGKLSKSIFIDIGRAIQSLTGAGEKLRTNFAVQNLIVEAYARGNQQLVRQVELSANTADRQRALNALLADYLAMLSRASAAQSAISVGVNPSLANRAAKVVAGRSAASGYIPSLALEQMSINSGIGGASPSARPVLKNLNLGSGRERVAVNSDEYIINNYGGSNASAIFNKDMVRGVGGAGNLNKFGRPEKVYADGYIPNLAPMSIKAFGPFGQNLRKLYKKLGGGKFPRIYTKDLSSHEALGLMYPNKIEIDENLGTAQQAKLVLAHEVGHHILRGTPISKKILMNIRKAAYKDFAAGREYPENLEYPQKYKTIPGLGSARVEEHAASSFHRLAMGRGHPKLLTVRYINKLLGIAAKNKASGSIPNLSPVKDSLDREMAALSAAGYGPALSRSSLRVGSSSRLTSKSNPFGLGVYNTAQGQQNIGQAINDHVPNFAPQIFETKGTEEQIKSAGKAFKDLSILIRSLNKDLGRMTRAQRASVNPNVTRAMFRGRSEGEIYNSAQRATNPNFRTAARIELQRRLKEEYSNYRNLKAPTVPSAIGLRDALPGQYRGSFPSNRLNDPITGNRLVSLSKYLGGAIMSKQAGFASSIENYKPSLLRKILFGSNSGISERQFEKIAVSSGINRSSGADGKFYREQRELNLAKLAQGRQAALTRGSFGIPVITGGLSSALGGDETQSGRLVSGLGSAVGTGAILASFGGIGVAAGVVVGALQAFGAVAKEVGFNFQKLSKSTQNTVAAIEKTVQSVQSSVELKNSLEDAIKNGASSSKISSLTGQYYKSLSGIGSSEKIGGKSLRSIITRGSADERDIAISEYIARQQRRAEGTQFTQAAGSTIEEKVGSFGKFQNWAKDNLLSPLSDIPIFGRTIKVIAERRNKLSKDDIDTLVRPLASQIDYGKLSKEKVAEFSNIRSGKGVISDSILKSVGLGNATTGFNLIKESFSKESFQDLSKTFASLVLLQKGFYELDKPITDASAAIGTLGRQLDLLTNAALSQNRVNLYQRSSNFNAAAVRAQNALEYNAGGASEYALASGKFAIDNQKIVQEANQRRFEALDQLSQSILDSVGSSGGADKRGAIARELSNFVSSSGNVTVSSLRSAISAATGSSEKEIRDDIMEKVLSSSNNIFETLQKIDIDEKSQLDIAKSTQNIQLQLLKQAERAAFYNTKALLNSDLNKVIPMLTAGFRAGGSLSRDTSINGTPGFNAYFGNKSIGDRLESRADLARTYLQGRGAEGELGIDKFTLPANASEKQKQTLLKLQQATRSKDEDAIYSLRKDALYKVEKSRLESTFGIIGNINKTQGAYDIFSKDKQRAATKAFDRGDYAGAAEILKNIDVSKISGQNSKTLQSVIAEQVGRLESLVGSDEILRLSAKEEATKGSPIEKLDASFKEQASLLRASNDNDKNILSLFSEQNNLTIGVQSRLDKLAEIFIATQEVESAKANYSLASGKIASLGEELKTEQERKNPDIAKIYKLKSAIGYNESILPGLERELLDKTTASKNLVTRFQQPDVLNSGPIRSNIQTKTDATQQFTKDIFNFSNTIIPQLQSIFSKGISVNGSSAVDLAISLQAAVASPSVIADAISSPNFVDGVKSLILQIIEDSTGVRLAVPPKQ